MVSNLGRFNVNQNTTITKQPWFEYIILAFASITQCLFCSYLVRIDRYDSFVLFFTVYWTFSSAQGPL